MTLWSDDDSDGRPLPVADRNRTGKRTRGFHHNAPEQWQSGRADRFTQPLKQRQRFDV